MKKWIFCLLGPLIAVAGASAQTLTKEQEFDRLRLRDSYLQLRENRRVLDSHEREQRAAQELFDQGYLSIQRYKETSNRHRAAQLSYEEAEIRLEKIKLDLLRGATRLTVVEARKYKEEGGKIMVDIVLENSSDTRNALLVDETLGAEELNTLLKVEDIYVSLSDGPIIGEPYEMRVSSLAVGERARLTFRLLRDTDSVYLSLFYLDVEEVRPLILEKGGDQELPSINSAQFSQEGRLNETVGFDLVLQWLSDEERSFVLAAIGLPQEVEYSFTEKGAKVNQVKFDQQTSKLNLKLELEIPENLDPRHVGRDHTFFAIVTTASQYGEIGALAGRGQDGAVTEAALQGLACRYVELKILPRGIGELEVLVANQYKKIEAGQDLRIDVQLSNRGTIAVQNVKAAVDLPYGWEKTVEPKLVKDIGPGQRVDVSIAAIPPEDVGSGDYELGIEAQGQVGTEYIESVERNITVNVANRTGAVGNIALFSFLGVMVAGIGLAGYKLNAV